MARDQLSDTVDSRGSMPLSKKPWDKRDTAHKLLDQGKGRTLEAKFGSLKYGSWLCFQDVSSGSLKWKFDDFSGASLQHLTAWLEQKSLRTLKEASTSTWSMEISWEFMRYPVDSRLCCMLWRWKHDITHPQALHKWFCSPTHCKKATFFSIYAALLGSPKLWSFSWAKRSTNR